MAESSTSSDDSMLEVFLRQLQAGALLRLGALADQEKTGEEGDKNTLLHTFATRGNYSRVKELLDNGAKPTIKKSESSTILHSAVTGSESEDEERAKILELFLQARVPINHQNSTGWTALKMATRRNLKKCVKVLLEHGANPDVADNEQYTPLHNAAGYPDMMRLLLTKAKEINSQNEDDETPLYVATGRGKVDSALALLEHGADPNIPNNENITPLFMAARDGKLELVKALVRKGANINSLGASQEIGPLHWAAHKEHEEIALCLVENGGDIMLKDKQGRTPLTMASKSLAIKMIVVAKRKNPLLKLATPPSSKNQEESNQAAAACCQGNVEEIEKMLKAGFPVDHASGRHNSTLLHKAAYHGQLQVVSLLMHHNADWKKTDSDGDTVLHLACMKESTGLHDKILEFLMTTPASSIKDAKNSNGDTAVMVATKGKFVSRVKVLLRFKVDIKIANNKKELPVHRACTSDQNIELVLNFVEMTPDINIQDGDGWTPLIWAAKTGSSAITKYLLLKGADPNIKMNQGFTALYLTASQNNPSMCLMLLEAGADPMIAGGRQDLTPLHIAAHLGYKDVCLVLVKHGADIHKEDKDGDTPMKLAKNAELKTDMQRVANKETDYSMSMVALQMGNRRPVLDKEDSVKLMTLPKKALTEIDYNDLELQGCLGEGGFGAVFKGKWKSKGMVVAVKRVTGVLEPREVHIPNSLPVHPNIIQFYGAVLKSPNCCLVLEYAENGSLYDHLHEKKIKSGLEWSLCRAKEIASGMLFLHQNDVIHRDLKSCNVLLSSDNTSKICDFGTARVLQHTTAMSKVAGTFIWMAPEILDNQGARVLSKACDVYSYGIVLWELIMCDIPYISAGLTGIQIALKVMLGVRPSIPPTCQQYLSKLMQECWKADPKQRPNFSRVLSVLESKRY